jgi:hypothetical protein
MVLLYAAVFNRGITLADFQGAEGSREVVQGVLAARTTAEGEGFASCAAGEYVGGCGHVGNDLVRPCAPVIWEAARACALSSVCFHTAAGVWSAGMGLGCGGSVHGVGVRLGSYRGPFPGFPPPCVTQRPPCCPCEMDACVCGHSRAHCERGDPSRLSAAVCGCVGVGVFDCRRGLGFIFFRPLGRRDPLWCVREAVTLWCPPTPRPLHHGRYMFHLLVKDGVRYGCLADKAAGSKWVWGCVGSVLSVSIPGRVWQHWEVAPRHGCAVECPNERPRPKA